MPSFLIDVEEIRKRAAQKIEEGPITETYEGDSEQTVSILNDALATEIVCVLRYMHHYFMATGVHAMAVRDEFKEHADAEREHADKIADRIQQLGGKPDFNPASLLERSASQYAEGKSLSDMIKEDLIAERIVIEVYQEMIRHFADHDPTTRVMIEGILKDEEEHAADLSDLLFITDPGSGETEGEDPGTHPLDMHQDEQSRQQRGKQPKAQADAGRTNRQSSNPGVSAENDTSAKMNRRELDVPATPRSGGGRTEARQPELGGESNEEGVGNMVSRDKTRLESTGRGRVSTPSGRGIDEGEGEGTGITNRGDKGQAEVVKGRKQLKTSGRGDENTPEHQPGGTGRPMNRRRAPEGGNLDTGNAGSMSGTNRSVKLTNKSNKKGRNRAA